MPVDLATLLIEVKGRGIAETTAQLDALIGAAGRTEAQVNRLAIRENDLARSNYNMQRAQYGAARELANAERATIARNVAEERSIALGIRNQAAINNARTALINSEMAASRAASRMAALGTAAATAGSGFRDAARDVSAMLMTAQTGLSGLPYALTRATSGFSLLLVGATIAMAGITTAFVAGLKVVDEYQIAIISIAAGLTTMAKPGQGAWEDLFTRNKEHAVDMYRTMTLEAAKHFATANEMMIVYNKLVQSGYAVREQEIGALGTITDLIKIKTKGQDVDRQLNTEIMALMQGQARAGSLLAQELRMRLGEGWADLVEKHRKAGDLLLWMASLYPGLTAANKDIRETITSQWTTMKSLVELITIGGMQGAYKDVVGLMKQMNDWLIKNEREISYGIAVAWDNVYLAARKVQDVYIQMRNAKEDIGTYLAEQAKKIPGVPEATEHLAQVEEVPPEQLSRLQAIVLLYKEAAQEVMTLNFWLSWWPNRINEAWESLKFVWSLLVQLKDLVAEPLTLFFKEVGLSDIWDKTENLRNWLATHPYVITIKGIWSYLTEPGGAGLTSPETSATEVVDRVNKVLETSPTLKYKVKGQVERLEMPKVPKFGEEPPIAMRAPDWFEYWRKKAPPETMPGAGRAPKGGKGGGRDPEAEARRLMSIWDTLNKDISRLSEGNFAEIEANYQKTLDDIYKYREVRDLTEAEVAAKALERRNLQMQKAEEDFWLNIAKLSGDHFAEIDAQYKKDVRNAGDNEARKFAVFQVWSDKTQAQIIKNRDAQLGREKEYLSTMAGAAPLLSDQLALQSQLLEIDIQQQKNKLDLLYYTKEIRLEEWQRLEPLRAQAELMQRQAEARKQWQIEGPAGGLRIWGMERLNEMQTRGATETVEALKSAETWMGDNFGQALVDKLQGKKTDIMAMFNDVAESFFKRIVKLQIQNIFDSLAMAIGVPGMGGPAVGRAAPAFGMKPDGSPYNPFYVSPAPGGGGFGGLGGYEIGGSWAAGEELANNFGRMWDTAENNMTNVSNRYEAVLNNGVMGLNNTAGTFNNVFLQAINGLLSVFSGGRGGGGMGGIGGLLGGLVKGIGGLFFGGMSFGEMSATGAGGYGAFEPSMFGGWKSIHRGGIIRAHGGLRLASDEVPIIAQTGERVLNRAETAAYERQPQINVSITTNTKNPVQARVTGQNNDIRVVIEDIVDQSIRGGKAFNAMKQTFNLRPSTVGKQ